MFKGNFGCGLFVIVLMLLFVAIGNWIKSGENASKVSSPPVTTQTSKVDGVTVEAKADVMMAKDKGSYNEMFSYIAHSNNNALVRMIQNGQVVVVKQGTKMNVLDRTFTGTLKLEVVSGDLNGVRGYLPEEMVK